MTRLDERLTRIEQRIDEIHDMVVRLLELQEGMGSHCRR